MIVEDTLRDATPGRPPQKKRRASWRRRLAKPAVLDVRVGPLLGIYAWRLRHHALQELLAGAGIAIGVALVFGVLTASQSITGSAGSILHAITGKATLEVTARGPDGFDERLVERIGELPGVQVASPVLRADAVLVGPAGRRSIQLVGVTTSELDLEGSASRYLGSERIYGSLALTSSVAGAVGAHAGGSITLLVRGRAESLPVHAVWGSRQIGAVASGPLVVGALSAIQRATALPRRVTQVQVEPDPGEGQRVRGELTRLANGRVDVRPIDHEIAVLDATAKPSTESLRLFAAIGAIVGFLFALNAMLLTVPDRRRWIAEARIEGYSASQIVLILGFQALSLGVVASAVGVALGYVLANTFFGALPAALTLYFPVGDHPIIAPSTIAVAAGAGVIAAMLAAAAPLRDLSARRPIDAVFHESGTIGHRISSRTLRASAALAALLIVLGAALALLLPGLTIAAAVLLAVGVLLVAPAVLTMIVAALTPAAERMRGSVLPIALAEIEGTATRSVALTAVAGLAVFASLTVPGARADLARGLDATTTQHFETAAVWVTAAAEDPYLVNSFEGAEGEQAITRLARVASVRVYQGSFLDVGNRRLWLRARPPSDRPLLQSSELLEGNLSRATRLVRAGGWAAVSSGFASEHHLALGSTFLLPTPSGPMLLRVAAVTMNAGWPPGTITMNDVDYQRGWRTSDPAALEVSFKPGVSEAAAKRAVLHAVSDRPGLRVQTASEIEGEHYRQVRQGLQNVDEISLLVLVAAGLAIAFALIAAIASHRDDLASRKTEGYGPMQLWRLILLEAAVVVGAGALAGTVLGVVGHALASRWLRLSLGFPSDFSVDVPELLLTLAVIAAVTLGVVGIAGWVAVRVAPRIGERE